MNQEFPPAWIPPADYISGTNVGWLMQHTGVSAYQALHAWSVTHPDQYWNTALERLGIRLRKPFSQVLDLSEGVESPRWLVDAKLNIVDSCFMAPPGSTAICFQAEGGELQKMTVGELESLTNRVAASLKARDFQPGAALAMIMPMTAESVAIYLGIIKAGCVAVGIPDSFQPREIAVRLRLSNAVAVFTQDVILRGGRELPLYSTVQKAEPLQVIVLPAGEMTRGPLRNEDTAWTDFLISDDKFESIERAPSDPINILFSSGTTGDPKAIPWTQTTPVKCAADAHFHQDIRPGDVVVWPTNIGWMMGPWLIFASLINRASMGLYYGAPTGREFAKFIQEAGTTMLGVIPSLVKAWRTSDCVAGCDWGRIRSFSSTGECSHENDMRWLMASAGGRPIIEYCGGTEIGGGYLTGTVALPCIAATFNTPALGLDVVILDEKGEVGTEGELFIVPPSIGLSTKLLNTNHHAVYFEGTPLHPDGRKLRRHGDQIRRLPDGRWRAEGRADDTMNLGGIKVSSAEIEKVVQCIPPVVETAAIAVSPGGGPSQLIIYAACQKSQSPDKQELLNAMQLAIKKELNPLFKIKDLVFIDALPRTASNKVMRRVLRDQYVSTS